MTLARNGRRPPQLLQPKRLRTIERPFGWLPCRLLTEGWLAALSGPARQLYLLLATAADRQGLSFYSDARINQALAFGSGELAQARLELTQTDLLAFDGRVYQLLCLPTDPPEQPQRSPYPSEPQQTPPTTSTPSSTGDAASPSGELPEDVQAILRKLLR